MPHDSERVLKPLEHSVTTKERGYPPRVEAILKKQALSPMSETGELRVRKLRNEVCVDNNNTLP